MKVPATPEKTGASRTTPTRQRDAVKERSDRSRARSGPAKTAKPSTASRKSPVKPSTDVWHYPAVVRSLLDGASLGIFIVMNGRVAYGNSALAKMLGLDGAETGLNQDSMNWVAPEDHDRVKAIRDARERGELVPERYQLQALRRDGTRFPVELTVHPVEWQGHRAFLATVADLTEQRDKELALRRSEERFRNLVEGSIQGMAVMAGGKLIFANAAAAKLSGFDRAEDLVGLDPLSFVAPVDKERIVAERQARLSGQSASDRIEFTAVNKKGKQAIVSVLAHPVTWDGQPAYLVTLLDVTQQRGAENALRRSEERFRNLVEGSIQGIIVMAPGKIIFANPAAARICGFNGPEEMIGLDSVSLVAPEDYERISRDRNARHRGEPAPEQFEVTLVKRNGGHATVSVVMYPTSWDGERVFLATFQDMSEFRRSERVIKEREERFRNLVEGSLQGLMIVRNDRIVFANLAAALTFGYGSPQELVTLDSSLALVALHERSRVQGYGRARMRGEKVPDHYEYQGLHKDGRMIWLRNSVRVVDWDGQPAIQTILLDITAEKVAEQQREALLENLRRANEELQDVAHIVAHDLKAPLRGINTLVEWLQEDGGAGHDSRTEEHLKELRVRTKRMSEMLDGILAYSRLGHEPPGAESLDSGELVAEVLETLNPPAGISVDVAPGLPVVTYDRTRLLQVFQNLVGNAIQHMGRPAGHVWVSCKEEPRLWRFLVTDDGTGIPPEQLGRVFKMFQRLKPGDNSGTGLGLSLVKKIVEQQGGTVSVESIPGAGSVFGFTIPKRRATA